MVDRHDSDPIILKCDKIIKFTKMNGPVQMYRAKPIVRRDIAVNLPDCMYKVKSIHASRHNKTAEQCDHVSPKRNLDISQQVKQFLKVLLFSTLYLRLSNMLVATKLTKVFLTYHNFSKMCVHDTTLINFCEQLSNN